MTNCRCFTRDALSICLKIDLELISQGFGDPWSVFQTNGKSLRNLVTGTVCTLLESFVTLNCLIYSYRSWFCLRKSYWSDS